MVQVNFARREVACKIVYYGPGMSGKTTNLEQIHKKAPPKSIGDLTSIATEGERTLFFDFLPLDIGEVAGMKTKFQIYTVPGQVYYAATRKLVLQGADGVVFVADSQKHKMDENIESLEDFETNLKANGLDSETLPWVLQYNKRDLPELSTIEELNEKLNKRGVPTTEAVAITGEGVLPTLKLISKVVLQKLNTQYARPAKKAPLPPAAAPAPATTSPPHAAPATPAAAASMEKEPAPKPVPPPKKPVEKPAPAPVAVRPPPPPAPRPAPAAPKSTPAPRPSGGLFGWLKRLLGGK